jgi:hypothetical protein
MSGITLSLETTTGPWFLVAHLLRIDDFFSYLELAPTAKH